MRLSPAKIEFNLQGTPVADQFDDVYFSNANGLEESRYVFLHSNQLPQRWNDCQNASFVIAETGFGTGLNFLATWQCFAHWQPEQPSQSALRMHFISCEKYPLSQSDLRKTLEPWTELQPLSEQLIQQYPDLVPGCHRLVFADGRVTLDLWLGDAVDAFSAIHNPLGGLVDAWYLDGFAPSKNPQMWQPDLFAQLARLSKPHATLATFTCAGVVKRGLKEQGFELQKVTGFGRKREMLTGRMTASDIERHTTQYFYRHPMPEQNEPLNVAIVGGGMAAANLAYSLAQRGVKSVSFCDTAKLADGASGNPQGGFYPQLNAQFNHASQLQALSFGFAKRRYHRLLADGFEFAHQWCGVLQLAFNSKVAQRQQAMIDKQLWPESLLQPVSASQCSEIAGIEIPCNGVFLAQGGWICPPQLVSALFTAAGQLVDCSVQRNTPVTVVHRVGSKWQINRHGEFDAVVIAAGADSSPLLQTSGIPLRHVRGQVETIRSSAPLSQLATVLCHKGYLTPVFEGGHALGSTYIKQDKDTQYRESEQQQNLTMHRQALSGVSWAENLQGESRGRASVRCSSPDHQPVVGALFDEQHQAKQFDDLYKAKALSHYPLADDIAGLYVLTALGSRGLTTAPLVSEVLASQICANPLPLSAPLLAALNPNRFLIRDLIRRQHQN